MLMFFFFFYQTLTFWSYFLLFYYIFMFWEERDIKYSKNTYLASFLAEVSYKILTELTLGG